RSLARPRRVPRHPRPHADRRRRVHVVWQGRGEQPLLSALPARRDGHLRQGRGPALRPRPARPGPGTAGCRSRPGDPEPHRRHGRRDRARGSLMPRAGLDADAVVAAAAALADASGLQQLTLARLAAALGIRTPSLYAHIDGLDDLRARLGARGAGELAATLQLAAAGRARGDARRAVALAYREAAHAPPGAHAATPVTPGHE